MNPRLPRIWVDHLVHHGSREVEGGFVWKADPVFSVGLPAGFDLTFIEAEHDLVSCPILVLTGSEPDTWSEHTPEEIEARLTHLAGARHQVVSGAGHYVHIEQPEAVVAAIGSFLDEVVCTERPVLVLHDAGEEGAGAPWRAALAEAGWPGPVLAPDLPGHGEAPAPCGGAYELMDAAVNVLPLLAEVEAGESGGRRGGRPRMGGPGARPGWAGVGSGARRRARWAVGGSRGGGRAGPAVAPGHRRRPRCGRSARQPAGSTPGSVTGYPLRPA